VKQSERMCFPIGTGAGIIMECSNIPEKTKIPQLTIMFPRWDGDHDCPATPAQSIELSSNQTKELYNALNRYYNEDKP